VEVTSTCMILRTSYLLIAIEELNELDGVKIIQYCLRPLGTHVELLKRSQVLSSYEISIPPFRPLFLNRHLILLDRGAFPASEGSPKCQIERMIGLNSSPLSSYATAKSLLGAFSPPQVQ
jgi:hypothetical protein